MISACPVMDSAEITNLDDAMAYHRAHELEFKVREQAARCAESCLASGKPWRCYFMAWGPYPRPGESVRSVEVTVDVRDAGSLQTATLIAEEQIRRQLAKFDWARLPDLAASR